MQKLTKTSLITPNKPRLLPPNNNLKTTASPWREQTEEGTPERTRLTPFWLSCQPEEQETQLQEEQLEELEFSEKLKKKQKRGEIILAP